MSLTHLDVTLEAIRVHGLIAVLLQVKSKMPASWCERCDGWTRLCRHYPGTRRVTQDLDEIKAHALRAKVGVLGGARVTILDFDRPRLFDEMCAALGHLAPTALSGGVDAEGLYKFHVWCAPTPDLPRALFWKGELVGEVIGEGFYATLPPAKHHKTGRRSKWLRDPRLPLQEIPAAWRETAWREYRAAQGASRAVDVASGEDLLRNAGLRLPPDEPWSGPPAEEVIRRALAQPGPGRDRLGQLRRDGGVKFWCSGCGAADEPRDNARVFPDGRWGCAHGSAEHRRAIAVQLGILRPLETDDHADKPMNRDDHADKPMNPDAYKDGGER